MKNNFSPICRKNDLVVQELNNEILVYDLFNNKAFCLNETSAIVWQAADGKKTVAEINTFLSKKLGSKSTEDMVWFALEQLKKENLLENGDRLPEVFSGMSRREVIKKVGLSSVIAIPVISSLVAPQSAAAQSCSPLLGACTTAANCCPGLGLNCNSNLCCDGTGFIGTTPANIANPIGNCGAGGAGARTAACDAACCSSAAVGSVFACTASTLTCQCV